MKTFKRAGKAIGGGKLTHVLNHSGKVVGHIVETLGFFMAHNNPKNPGEYVVCNSMDEAKGVF